MIPSRIRKRLAGVPRLVQAYGAWLRWRDLRRARRRFKRQFREFAELTVATENRFSLEWKDRFPCLGDDTDSTPIDRHYVYHTAWAARVLAKARPRDHVDISSYIFFSAMMSAFFPVRFFDYRPVDLGLENLATEFADLLQLPFASGSLESLSCMHVVEHVGLGRYGDPLDPDGDRKAMAELARVLAPGGCLLLVVPIGRPKIEFNAHRIYEYEQVVRYLDGLAVEEFALVPDGPDQGGLIRGASPELANRQNYGCGCFLFRKRDDR